MAGLLLIFFSLILIVFLSFQIKRNKRQARATADTLKNVPGDAGAEGMPEETLDRLLKKNKRKRTVWKIIGAVAVLAYLAYILISVLKQLGSG